MESGGYSISVASLARFVTLPTIVNYTLKYWLWLVYCKISHPTVVDGGVEVVVYGNGFRVEKGA